MTEYFLDSNVVLYAYMPSTDEGAKNPNIVFAKGLLTVQAEDVTLESLLDEMSKKTGIGVTVSPSLKTTKVSVQLENVTMEAGLRHILQSANIVK